ncbi:MAG: hypothetical protein HY288_20610 [Planctomycetia bacterium]|nr:hypothetical protein [Planctomycetia bacterium]
MGLFGFSKTSFSQTTPFKDTFAHYQRLRPIRFRLNNELVRRLSRDALNQGAKKIGILRGGTFVFENEDETSVLMDYCIYDVYRKGRNAVEQYLCDVPPDPDSDEVACLRAMQQATYALVAVLRVESGVGCHVRNLFTEETRLLVDIGLSETAQPGMVIATRLLDFGDFVATGGAALPLGILDKDELDAWQRKIRAGANDDRSDPAPLIRACLQRGASANIRYEEMHTQRRSDVGGSPPAGTSAQRRRALAKRLASKAATNQRCRCGSGKMYKNCCGKR